MRRMGIVSRTSSGMAAILTAAAATMKHPPVERNEFRSTSCRRGSVLLAPRQQIGLALAMAEVAERLATLAVLLEIGEEGQQRGHDLVRRHDVLVDKVKPVAQQ